MNDSDPSGLNLTYGRVPKHSFWDSVSDWLGRAGRFLIDPLHEGHRHLSDSPHNPFSFNAPVGGTKPISSNDKGGPYSNLKDSNRVGEGKDFTRAQKRQIIEQNKAKNGGVPKSDQSGEEGTMPQQSQKGVTPPDNEIQIDHINPKNPADPDAPRGTNSYSNAQVLLRRENIEKSNK